MKIELAGEFYEVKVLRDSYQGGVERVRLVLLTGAPFAEISCNCNRQPPAGCFWLKDWSENAAVVAQLIQAGMIEVTGFYVDQGRVVAKEARLNKSLGVTCSAT
jgi:hypothetical protein